jgi:hypothetical protein
VVDPEVLLAEGLSVAVHREHLRGDLKVEKRILVESPLGYVDQKQSLKTGETREHA